MTRLKTPTRRPAGPHTTSAFILLAGYLLFGTLATAEETEKELSEHWKIEKFQWTGSVGENKVIEIRNTLGDIRTRLSSDDQVFVSAVIQRHENDPREADVQVSGEDGRIRVETAFVARQSVEPQTLHEGMEKRRIDLTVIVPLGVRLEAQTGAGLIEAKGLESDVVAESVSGNIVLSITGGLRAHTERGEITATFRSADWGEVSELKTTTGDVTVWLPPDADAIVRAETSGLITTDYSVDIERERRSGVEHKLATAKIGQGTRQLSIETLKGGVRILRSPH